MNRCLPICLVALLIAGCGGEAPDRGPVMAPAQPAAAEPFPVFSSAEEVGRTVRFPAGSGVIDVTQPPYGAVGDGVTDNTATLRRAIADHLDFRAGSRTLYFPAGVYLVSDSLTWQDGAGVWKNYLSLQGESRERSVIRLADRAPGFGEAGAAKALLRTGSLGPWKQNGNAGFANYLADLTLSTGRGNPGAIALDYLGNNDASVRNLLLVAEDGAGVAGFAAVRSNSGPYLAKNLEIRGFQDGVRIGSSWYGHVFEYLLLSGQGRAGIRICPARGAEPQGPVVALRRVTYDATVPLLVQEDPSSLVVLDAAQVRQAPADPAQPLLRLDGQAVLRDLVARQAVWWLGDHRGERLEAHTMAPTVSAGPPALTLRLPVAETPYRDPGDPATWASVTTFGADPRDAKDDAPAIQAALDSGAAVVYFPVIGKTNDAYLVQRTLTVPDSVTHILGLGARVKPPKDHPGFYRERGALPILRLDGRRSDPLFLERLKLDEFWHVGKLASIHHHGSRPLVLRDMLLENYQGFAGCGPLFLESVACATLTAPPAQRTWARHLNPESIGDKVLNQGGDLWVLGLKSEQASTLLTTTAGGRSEVLGALQTASPPIPRDVPIFRVDEGRLEAALAVRSLSARQSWTTLAAGPGTQIGRSAAPGRPSGPYDVLAPALVLTAGTVHAASDDPILLWSEAGLVRAGRADEALDITVRRTCAAPEAAEAAATATILRLAPGERLARLDLPAVPAGMLETLRVEAAVRTPPPRFRLPEQAATAVPEADLVLRLEASAGVELDGQRQAAALTDLSPHRHAVDGVTAARRPAWERIGGRDALRFADDQLEIHLADALHGRVLAARTWGLVLHTGAEVTTRQVIYHEGAEQRGVMLYLEQGALNFTGWNVTKDGPGAAWPFTHLQTPVRPGQRLRVLVVLDGRAPTLRLIVDGAIVAQSDQAGYFGAHRGGRSFLGVLFKHLPFPGAPAKEPTPVEARGGHPFHGALESVLIWNRALDDAEIQALHGQP